MSAWDKARERDSGRYSFAGGFERLCRCGHSFGEHAAERVGGEQPCFHGDAHPDEPCDCACFTPLRRKGKA